MPILDPELKKALSLLPEKEKDKLLFQLLRKDKILEKKLYFKWVETKSIEEIRQEKQDFIQKHFDYYQKSRIVAHYLLRSSREINKIIAEHVTITKDSFGEISLNLFFIKNMLTYINNAEKEYPYYELYDLGKYLIIKVIRVLLWITKQHEDLHLDFKHDVISIGVLISQNQNISKHTLVRDLNLSWLIDFDLPHDYEKYFKELQTKGLLR